MSHSKSHLLLFPLFRYLLGVACLLLHRCLNLRPILRCYLFLYSMIALQLMLELIQRHRQAPRIVAPNQTAAPLFQDCEQLRVLSISSLAAFGFGC